MPMDFVESFQFSIKILHELTFYIHRLRKKEPLITAKDLQEVGIAAGPKMGKLLEQAWKIAINQNLKDKTVILEKLKSYKIEQNPE